jgi:predicted P-loop ATPase
MTQTAIEREAKIEQKARYIEDPWHVPIARYVENQKEVSFNELLARVCDMSVEDFDQRAQNRVVACLKQLGYERFRKRIPGTSRLEWLYRRTTPGGDQG